EWGKTHSCCHEAYTMPARYECYPLIQPLPRHIPMDEHVPAEFQPSPVTDLDRKPIGAQHPNGVLLGGDVVQAIQNFIGCRKLFNFHRIIDKSRSRFLIEEAYLI